MVVSIVHKARLSGAAGGRACCGDEMDVDMGVDGCCVLIGGASSLQQSGL
jgi:hypothetical protein